MNPTQLLGSYFGIRFSGLLAVIMILFIVVIPVFAQGESPGSPTDDEVNAVARQLYCPVCENIPLDVCPTQACIEWRALIRLKLSEGWGEDQIKQYFVEQYGARVLASPPASGFNWLVYIVPPIAIGVGIFIVYKVFASLRRTSEGPIEGDDRGEAPADDYVEQLEEELRRR